MKSERYLSILRRCLTAGSKSGRASAIFLARTISEFTIFFTTSKCARLRWRMSPLPRFVARSHTSELSNGVVHLYNILTQDKGNKRSKLCADSILKSHPFLVSHLRESGDHRHSFACDESFDTAWFPIHVFTLLDNVFFSFHDTTQYRQGEPDENTWRKRVTRYSEVINQQHGFSTFCFPHSPFCTPMYYVRGKAFMSG